MQVMRSRVQSLQRTPVTKLADIFCKAVDVVLTDQALADAPCQNLSRSQWEGTLFVQRHAYCSIRDLAEGLAVSHPAAVKMVERLVRKGLLERRESMQDRRVVELSLSPLGDRCVDSVRDQRAQALEKFLAEMSPEDTERLLTGLHAFLEAVLQDRETAEAVCLHCGREHVEECLVSKSTGGVRA
jgi:DNA-binding MarR family transcriptional regulator